MVKSVSEGLIGLSIAQPGDTPEFRSTGKLLEGQEVTVTVKGANSWNIEAGGDIEAGADVGVGDDVMAIESVDRFGDATRADSACDNIDDELPCNHGVARYKVCNGDDRLQTRS